MSTLTRETVGNCAVLTMNRPEALNAITTEMLDSFERYLDEIEADDTRALILTGAGRGFCPGSDLKEPPSDVKARIEQVHGLILRLVNSLCDTPEEVVQLAHDFVNTYCQFSLVPQQAIRRAIRGGADLPLRDALAHEYEILEAVSASEDCMEGVMAFIEKRERSWKDR